MAANLQIGRAGLDTALEHPHTIGITGGVGSRRVSIRGHIKDTATLEQALGIRRQLLSQVSTATNPNVVAVSSAIDSRIDGYYRVISASVDATAKNASLISTGFLPYSVSLEEIPTAAFSVGATGALLPNDHSVVAGSPFIAGPVSTTSFTPETIPIIRAGEDGNVYVYDGILTSDLPVFTCAPANFYSGSCTISTGNPLIVESGKTIRDLSENWQISNSLIRVTGNTSGYFTVDMHDGTSWVSSRQWRMQEGGTDVGSWDHVVATFSTPERVGVMLIQNRSGAGGRGRRTLTFTLRRGARHVSCYHTTTISSTIKIGGVSNDTGINFSPYGVRRSANDSDTNRWIVGSVSTHTNDLTNGAISVTASLALDFFIGFEVAGSGAQTGDEAANIAKEYVHPYWENVTPMPMVGV